MQVRLLLAIVLSSLILSLTTPQSVIAASNWGSCVVEGVATISCLEPVFGNILQAILPLLGIAAFIMILYGGFQILISGGDPKKTEVGQKTLTYAVFGLIAIFISWFILMLLSEVFLTQGGNINNSPLLQFKLLFPQ